MSALTRIYERLPPTLQSAAASLRGYWLRSLRYGPGSEQQAEEALERDSWSELRWKNWQEDVLARILHRAATRVPYYRDQWSERRRRGDRASWELLANWPILTKTPLRQNPGAFVADDCETRRMILVSTSGSTGTPLLFWRSRATEQAWYALVEARLRRWNGFTRHDRWINLGAQRVTPGGRRRPPYWVWNGPMHQLYMSTFHVAPDAVPAYLAAMKRYRGQYILGLPSAGHALAQTARERGLEAPRLRLFLNSGEKFHPFQREAIASVFQCDVRDTYGQAEIVCAASECASGSLHLWPDVGVTEWMRADLTEPALPGEAGELVCTGLLNADMPLIRYAFGDQSRRGGSGGPCGCGRALPVMTSIDGRTFDVFRTPSGIPVMHLAAILHPGLLIREAQFVQQTLHRIQVRVVASPGFGDEHRQDLIRGVRTCIGDEIDVEVVTVESIPRTSAGKFRDQVSLIGGPTL